MTADETLFTWLHLSDIHWTHGNAGYRIGQNHIITQKLIDDLALRRDRTSETNQTSEHSWIAPKPDAIFITGDVAHKGGANKVNGEGEYARARASIERICRTVDVNPTSVYLVPGNHDVERYAGEDTGITPFIVKHLRTQNDIDEALCKPDVRALLEKRFAGFLQFAATFAPSSRNLFWNTTIVGRHGLKVRVIGLNTALLCLDDNDNGKLWLGASQTEGIGFDESAANNNLTIALSHHPFAYGWLGDETSALDWARNNCHIHLSGHRHIPQIQATTQDSSIPPFVQVTAHALHAGPNEPPCHGYNIGSIIRRADGCLMLRVYPRRWAQRDKRFRKDSEVLSTDARHYAELDLRRKLEDRPELAPFPIPEPFVHEETVKKIVRLASPGTKICVSGPNGTGRTTVIRAAANVLTRANSRIIVLDLTGGLASPEWQDLETRRKTAAPMEKLESLRGEDILLVVGYPETDLLRVEIPGWKRLLSELPCTVLAATPKFEPGNPRGKFFEIPMEDALSPAQAYLFLGKAVELGLLETRNVWTPLELKTLRKLKEMGADTGALLKDGEGEILTKSISIRSKTDQQLLEILSRFPRGTGFAEAFVQQTWNVVSKGSPPHSGEGPDALLNFGILERIDAEIRINPTYQQLLQSRTFDHRGVGKDLLQGLLAAPFIIAELLSFRGPGSVRAMLDDIRHVARFGHHNTEDPNGPLQDTRAAQAHEMWRLLTNLVQATSGPATGDDVNSWLSRLHMAAYATRDSIAEAGRDGWTTLTQGLARLDQCSWKPNWVHSSPAGRAFQKILIESKEVEFNALQLSNDGALLVGDSKGRIWRTTLDSGTTEGNGDCHFEVHGEGIWALAVDKNGYIYTGADDGLVGVCDQNVKKIVQKRHCGSNWFVNAIALAPSGEVLFSGADDARILKWRILNGKTLSDLEEIGHVSYGGWILSLHAYDDNKLLSGHQHGLLMRWERIDGRWVSRLAWSARGAWIRTIIPNPDKNGSVFVGLYDGRVVELIDDNNGYFKVEREFRHGCAVRGIALIKPNGRRQVVTGGDDGSLRVWQESSGNLLRTCQAHRGHVRTLLALDHRRIVSAGSDGRVLLWDFAESPLHIKDVLVDDERVRLCADGENRSWLVKDGADDHSNDATTSDVVEHVSVHNCIIEGTKITISTAQGKTTLTLLGEVERAAVSSSGHTVAAWDDAGRVYCFSGRS